MTPAEVLTLADRLDAEARSCSSLLFIVDALQHGSAALRSLADENEKLRATLETIRSRERTTLALVRNLREAIHVHAAWDSSYGPTLSNLDRWLEGLPAEEEAK